MRLYEAIEKVKKGIKITRQEWGDKYLSFYPEHVGEIRKGNKKNEFGSCYAPLSYEYICDDFVKYKEQEKHWNLADNFYEENTYLVDSHIRKCRNLIFKDINKVCEINNITGESLATCVLIKQLIEERFGDLECPKTKIDKYS